MANDSDGIFIFIMLQKTIIMIMMMVMVIMMIRKELDLADNHDCDDREL